MPFSKEENIKLIELFSKGKLNEFALIIVGKVFENLTQEENKNWFENILDHCQKIINNNDNNHKEAIKQSTVETVNIEAIKLSKELFNMFQIMALEGKFRNPPQ